MPLPVALRLRFRKATTDAVHVDAESTDSSRQTCTLPRLSQLRVQEHVHCHWSWS